MIKVSVLYQYGDQGEFDWAYYREKHIPMVLEKLGTAVRGVSVERGLNSGAPGVPPLYKAMAHLLFESPDAFYTAYAPHLEAISADAKNYTDATAVVQLSEVLLSAKNSA
jgi:uncharacterized protein (TIGR02118 family)